MTDRELNPVLVSVAQFLGSALAYIAFLPVIFMTEEEADRYAAAFEAWLDRIAE